MSEKGRLFLFSGMGGDSRLFGELRIPNAHLIASDHLEPNEGETLVQYAKRVAQHHQIGPDDIVGGASFGGMLAAQIATDQKVAGLIMLASCFGPSGLPAALASAEQMSRWLPDGALKIKSWRPLIRWRFDPITPEAEEVVLAMGKDFPANWLRRFARMIATWPGVAKPTVPTLVIHGDRDRLIACDRKIADVILPEAGHAFMLTHAKQTNSAISAFLVRLS